MQAQEVIRKQPCTIGPDATIAEAARRMDRYAVGALVIVEGDRPVGIVTDRDIVVRGVARGADLAARIDGLMTTDVITLEASADVRAALPVFQRSAIRRLPLVENGCLVGMLTLDDLLVDLVDDLQNLVRPVAGQVLYGHPEPAPPIPI